jgi:hypothetical protein
MVSLVAYMDVGRRRLEEAWWRAFADEDLAALVGDWLSLIKGAAAAWMPVGEPQGSGRLQTPLSIDTAAGLSLEFDSPAAAAQARAAQQATIATIESMVSAIRERSEPASTGMGPWLSSGAFASLRDQLEMLGYLSGVGAESPDPAAVSLSRALRAAQRADPEAVLIHLARAVHAADAGAVEAADPVTASLLTRTVEAARRLAAGEHLDHSAVALLAGTALPATASLLSEPPGASA